MVRETRPEDVFPEIYLVPPLVMLKGHRRTNNASTIIILGSHPRKGLWVGTEAGMLWPPTSVSSRQAVCQEQRSGRTNFLLLKGVLPGISAAAFKKDAKQPIWIPMIPRASDSLQGWVPWCEELWHQPQESSACPGHRRLGVCLCSSWNHCAGDTHTICSGWLVKAIFCF